MALGVIVLNWNAAGETIRCACAVQSWRHLEPEVWIVDNASTDSSADTIAEELPDTHLIRNPQNLGFGDGNNQGIARALAAGNAPILLLNNDASIHEADVERLLTTLREHERLGFVGPLLYDIGERPSLHGAGGKDIATHLDTHHRRLPCRGPICQVRYVPGTVALVRTEVFHTAGLFDSCYFFSGEMADLCERARRQGLLSAVDSRARAYHAQHDPSNLRATLYVYYALRNRFLFIRKFRAGLQIPLCSFWTLYGLAIAGKARLRGRRAVARAIRLAICDGLRGQFGGQNERVQRASTGVVPGGNRAWP
jgi:GT2 family glycosyltransferase